MSIHFRKLQIIDEIFSSTRGGSRLVVDHTTKGKLQMIFKQARLAAGFAIAAMLAIVPAPVRAMTLDFNFSYQSDIAGPSGLVSGTISGLTINSVGAADSLMASGGLLGNTERDFIKGPGAFVIRNEFTVDNGGNIVSFFIISILDGIRFDINSSFPLGSPTFFNNIIFANGTFSRATEDVAFSSVSAVPLPAALPLMGAGFAALGFVGWRRKRKVA